MKPYGDDLVNVSAQVLGLRAAVRRLEDATDQNEDAIAAYAPLFEALHWIVAIDDRIGVTWAPDSKTLGEDWRDRVNGGCTIAALDWARNLVHHQWADALRLEPSGQGIYPSDHLFPSPDLFPLRDFAWVWRDRGDLPKRAARRRAKERSQTDPGAQAYDEQLAGRSADATLREGLEACEFVAGLLASLAVPEQRPAAPRPPLQGAKRRQHHRVGDRLDVSLPALRAIVEHGLPALEVEVLAPERREAVGLVLLRVALAPDAEEAEVEQPDRAREDALAHEAPASEVLVEALAKAGQRRGEVEHPVELHAVLAFAPSVVVAVLLAPGSVDSGCLDVATLIGADPHVLPSRRDGERSDPLEHVAVANRLAVLSHVREAAAAPHPPDPGRGAIDAAKARHGGAYTRIREIPARGALGHGPRGYPIGAPDR